MLWTLLPWKMVTALRPRQPALSQLLSKPPREGNMFESFQANENWTIGRLNMSLRLDWVWDDAKNLQSKEKLIWDWIKHEIEVRNFLEAVSIGNILFWLFVSRRKRR